MNRRGFLGSLAAAFGLATTCRKAPPLNAPTTLDALYGGAAGGGKTSTFDGLYSGASGGYSSMAFKGVPLVFDRERLRTHARYRGPEIVPPMRQLELMSSPTEFEITAAEFEYWLSRV